MKSHIENLEAESIYIIREALAESKNPVMLYSLGKDSSVMLHIAKKAFSQEITFSASSCRYKVEIQGNV